MSKSKSQIQSVFKVHRNKLYGRYLRIPVLLSTVRDRNCYKRALRELPIAVPHVPLPTTRNRKLKIKKAQCFSPKVRRMISATDGRSTRCLFSRREGAKHTIGKDSYLPNQLSPFLTFQCCVYWPFAPLQHTSRSGYRTIIGRARTGELAFALASASLMETILYRLIVF